jgi:Divergent InlB B-repeat domain
MRHVLSGFSVVGILFLLHGLAGATPTFGISGTAASPNPVQNGVTMTITTTITNTSTEVASGVIVDEEIFDATGTMVNQGTTSGHQYTPGQTLNPGEIRSYTWYWTIPPTLPAATYTLKIGVYQDHWTQLYAWDNNAATFTVQSGGPSIAFTIAAITADPNAIQPGQSLTFTTQVTNIGSATASGINILLEARDPLDQPFAGNQAGLSGETFAPGQMKTYSFTLTIPTGVQQGVYSASLGVFDASWSVRYAWRQNAQAFTVGTTTVPAFTFDATTVSPDTVLRGQDIIVNTRVTDTNQAAINLKVSLEIRNASDVKVLQQYYDSQSFGAGESRAYVYTVPIPTSLPLGQYSINIAVYSGTWTLYNFGYHLAALTVTATDPGVATLTVARAGSGDGTVTSSPAGINCGATCSAVYGAGGTVVTLTATPATGFVLTGWDGGGCAGTGPCVVSIHADTTVTAYFGPPPPPDPGPGPSPGPGPVLAPALTVGLNKSVFHAGDALDTTLALTNPGPARPVDVYLAVLLPGSAGPGLGCPNGDAVAFVAEAYAKIVITCLSAPVMSPAPLFTGVTMPAASGGLTLSHFWSLVWNPGLPAGSYTVVVLTTVPGTFADGQLGAGDVVAMGMATLTFTP